MYTCMDLCIQGFHAWRPIASAIIAVPRLGPAKAVTFTAPLIRAVGAYGRLCGGNSAHSVLVLGGDGLAARELLRQPGVDKIVQVELDPAVIELARTTMRSANGGSLDNPRVHVITDDAMTWLRGNTLRVVRRANRRSSRPGYPGTGPVGFDRVLRAGFAGAGARGAEGGSGGRPVFDPDRVLAHGFHDRSGRLRGHSLPRVCPHLRRLGVCLSASRWLAAATHDAAKPAAAALSQPIGTRRGHSVRCRCATPHTRAVNAGTSARRRGHAPRLRLAPG